MFYMADLSRCPQVSVACRNTHTMHTYDTTCYYLIHP